MIFLQNFLAKYEIHVARYYMDRGAYVAALRRSEKVLVEFQGTTSVENALKVMIDAYQELNLPDYARQTQEVLRLNSGRLANAQQGNTNAD
jgi:outer membrane protein assembly factor BamD